jgi:hypothetical protein
MRPTVYPETVEMIVAEYDLSEAERVADADWWRADGHPFLTVIDRVGNAVDARGKRHSHQWRLNADALAKGKAALHGISDQLQQAPDFLQLWFLVQDAFKPIWGLGELAVYDTTERLRHRLRLESAHVIFLHAGTRVGARRLAGGRLKPDDAWGIHRDQVPDRLRHLSTHEIEDVLCIYKDELLLTPDAFLARRSKRGPSRCGLAPEPRSSC